MKDGKDLAEKAKRRMHHINNALSPGKRRQDGGAIFFRETSGEGEEMEIDYFEPKTLPNRIIIGDVHMDVQKPANPELIPFHLESWRPFVNDNTQEMFSHLRWMVQKDLLKQDMFLIGFAGKMVLLSFPT